MMARDVIDLLDDADYFEIVKESVGIWKDADEPLKCSQCIEPTFSDCESCSSIDADKLSLKSNLVFKGSKKEFFEPLLTEYEKKVGGKFSLSMAKNRHVVQSFPVKSISFGSSRIVVIDPEQRLKSIS